VISFCLPARDVVIVPYYFSSKAALIQRRLQKVFHPERGRF